MSLTVGESSAVFRLIDFLSDQSAPSGRKITAAEAGDALVDLHDAAVKRMQVSSPHLNTVRRALEQLERQRKPL